MASTQQLRRRGLTSQAIARAVAAGRLFVYRRGIYSIVPADLVPYEGRICAALLLGGAGAALAGASSAYELRLLSHPPAITEVSVGAARRPVAGIRWRYGALRDDEVIRPGHFPLTTPARTALDLAAEVTKRELKRILAEIEYHHGLTAEQVVAMAARRGHPGVARLKAVAAEHTPQLAETRSHLEDVFVELLQHHGFVLPNINHPTGTATVDAVYDDPPIAIELDGVKGHTGGRRVLRDHRRDVHRRADGYLTLRYHHAQLAHDAELVVADLTRAGAPRAADAAA